VNFLEVFGKKKSLFYSKLNIMNNNKIIKDTIKDSINSASSSNRFYGDDLISSPLEDLF
jgi:hypothetical protein